MSESMPSGLPFDRVTLGAAGRERSMTVDEFLALPLASRVEFILRREVGFFRRGLPVDRREALRALRESTDAQRLAG